MDIPDWVDKYRDAIHMNYDWGYTYYNKEGDDPVHFWLSEAATRTARDASVTKDCFMCVVTEPQHLKAFWNQSLLVCLRIVTIHAPLQPALDSGLFGLLGDARVVLVDATDTERQKRYRTFSEAHGVYLVADPHPARFFDNFCQEETWVGEEVKKLQITWLRWQWIRTKDQIADADAAWSKRTSLGEVEQVWTWKQWIPDREHWWMRDMLKVMPELHPTIMFRLCTQMCPVVDSPGRPRVLKHHRRHGST